MQKYVLIGLVVGIIFISGCIQQIPENTIKVIPEGTIKVKLLDAFSGRTISNVDVRVYSDNGIRCVTTPCDTEAQEWAGKSDSDGIVLIPAKVINVVTSIIATGYKSGRDLNEDSDKIANNYWSIELDPDERIDNFERRLKLIDSQTQKPLSDVPLWIINDQNCRPPQCSDYSFTGTTNSLGNIYYPISSIKDGSLIFVNGYKSVKFPTGWVNYRIILEKE